MSMSVDLYKLNYKEIDDAYENLGLERSNT